MPVTGPCAAACAHSEQECAACLANQYAGGCSAQLVALGEAEAKGIFVPSTAAALRLYVETGEKMFRNALSVPR